MKPKRSNPLFAGFFRRNVLASAVVVSLTGFAMPPSAQAANLYWDTNAATAGSGNAAGTWDTGTNWSTDSTGASATTGWLDGESAVIAAGTDGVGAYTITLAGTVSTPSILVEEAGAKTIAGGTINIGAGSITTAAAGNGNAFTISSILAGAGGLTVAANGDVSDTGGGVGGHLLLSGVNTISGDITINSGIVRSISSFGDAGNKVVLSGGGIVDTGANTVFSRNIEIPATKTGVYRTYGAVSGQLTGAITGSGILKHSDTGTLTLNGNFSGFTGSITNGAGTLIIGAASTNLATIPFLQTENTNVLRLGASGDTSIKSLTSDRDVVVPFGSRLNIVDGTYTTVGAGGAFNGFWAQGTTAGTASATGEITSSGGTLTVTNGAPTGNLTTTDNRIRLKIVDFNGGTPLALVKNNNNSLVLDMVNTHTGGTTINGGRVNADNVSAFGTGTVTVNSGGQAGLFAAGTFANNFVINGIGVTEAAGNLGAIRFGNNTVSGSINVASAARMVAYGATGTHSGALTGSAALDLNLAASPGTISFTGTTSGYTGAMTLNAGTLNVGASGLGGSLTITAGTANVTGGVATDLTASGTAATVGGAIGGNVVSNAGTTTLNGAVTGNVAINGGRTNLNGTVAGNVTMADLAKVGGEGSITGTLNLGATSGSDIHLNASTAGALTTGTVNLVGTNYVVIDTLPTVAGPFVVLDYTTLGAGDETNFLVPTGVYRGDPQVQHDIGNTQFTLELDSQVRTWNNSALTGSWNTTDANWVEGDNLFFNGDDVAFTNTAVGTVNLGTNLQPLSVTLSNTAGNDYIFAGGSIIGTTGITMNGGGGLTLAGANTYTGAVAVNAGVLTLNSQQALGVTSGVAVASGARVNINGQSPGGLATGGYSWTIAGDGGDGAGGLGAITNSGGDVYGNSGVKNLNLSANAEIGGNNGRFDIGLHGGTSTYGTINGGGFTLTKVGSNAMVFRAPASNISYVVNAGQLTFEDYDSASGTNPITVNAGTLGSYNNRTLPNDVTFAAGGNTLVSLAGSGIWTGGITLNGDTTFSANGGNLVIDGSLAGTGNITKNGGNVLVLQNSSASFSGKINNTAGTLRIESASATGTYSGADAITLSTGTTLQGGTITALASATVGSATQGILQNNTTGAAANVNYDAGAGATLTINGGITSTGAFASHLIKANNSGALVFNREVNIAGKVSSNGGSQTFNGNLILGAGSAVEVGTSIVTNINSPTFTAPGGILAWTGTTNIAIGTGTIGRLTLQEGSNQPHTVNHTAGALTVASDIRLGHWSGGVPCVYNISGGSLNQPDTVTSPTSESQANLFIGIDGFGNLNISGTGVVNTTSLVVNGRGGTTADTLNLTGGRLNIGKWGIRNPGTAFVNLGGGTVGASADWASSTPMILTGTGGNVSFDTLDSVNGTSARLISLTGVISGTGGLTKKGAGTLALSNAAGTFSGVAQVEGGTLLLNSNAAVAATVKSVAGGTVQAGTIATPGTANIANLNLDGGSALFRVGTATDLLNVTGTLTVSSPSSISASPGNAISGPFPVSYTVIDYTGTIAGPNGFSDLSYSSANPHLSGTLVNDTTNTQIKVQISAADSVIWKGNVNGNWDVNTTSNWVLGSDNVTSSKYYDFDVVKFDDGGLATPTVTLAGTIKPATLAIENTSGTYTFQGTGITGSTSLTKSGSGNLVLLNDNTYVGTTSLSGGTVTVGAGGTVGTLGGTGSITLNSSTLTFNRSDAQTLSRSVVGSGSTLVKNGGNLTMGAGGNTCDIVVNSGTLFARGGGFSAAFAAGKMITVNTGAVLDTAVHSMGSSVGGGGDVPMVTLNGANWILNGEQYMRTLNMTAATTTKVGTLDGIRTLSGSVFTINAAATSSTIGSPLNLVNAVNLAVNDGAATDDLVITGPVSNAGAVTKTGDGTMVIAGTNTSTGSLTISAGTVQVGDGTTNGALGTGAITNNSSLVIKRSDAVSVPNTISGTGDLVQSGAGTTTLGGTNTYTGDTIVNAGVLAIDGDSISDDGALVVDGGVVNVTNNETVQKLFFGASEQAIGTYGATGSGATFINDTRFSGTGIVTVTGAGYSSWITTFGLVVGDQDPTDDPDGDGVSNAVEWVLGGNPATGMDAAKLPTVTTSGGNLVFTFRRDQDSKVAGTSVAIQVGTSLAGWPTSFTVGNDTAGSSAGVTVIDNLDGTDTITLTVAQAPDAAKFARLSVSIN